jgi:hypothetical protein
MFNEWNYLIILILTIIYNQSSHKPSGPKTEASEFEVGSVKIEIQEVRLAFSFDQTFYGIF